MEIAPMAKKAATKKAAPAATTAAKKTAAKKTTARAPKKAAKKKSAKASEAGKAAAEKAANDAIPDKQTEFPGFFEPLPEHIDSQLGQWLGAKKAAANATKKRDERYAALLQSCLDYNEQAKAEGKEIIRRIRIPGVNKFVNVTAEDKLKIETIPETAKKDAKADSLTAARN